MVERHGGGGVPEILEELDALLDGIGERLALPSAAFGVSATPAPSGRLYNAITRYWPRIAAGLVGLGVVSEFALGRLSVGGSLESYVFAWATTTGGLWFMFDKAEKALSADHRRRVVGWVRGTDLKSGIESIPAQFAFLFDRIFGEKHLSRHCFNRSCVASALSFLMIWMALSPSTPGEFSQVQWSGIPLGFGSDTLIVLAMVVPFNFLPDYLSLLETRWAIGWMERTGRIAWVLAFDLVATAAISVLGMAVIIWLLLAGLLPGLGGAFSSITFLTAIQIALLSAWFTSVWLWIYVASVFVSRALVRMGGGVGFLLRVTDLERQPFRSIGFVSVIVASLIFLAGLPLVLV